MSNRMWENTVEHVKTCVLGGKLYVNYAAGTHSTGVVFNNVYEPRCHAPKSGTGVMHEIRAN